MRIFICYPRELHSEAELIAVKLINSKHKVFWDQQLEYSSAFDKKIKKEIDRADLVILLIAPVFFAPNKYTLTELGYVKKKWRDPEGRILPVIVKETPLDLIPGYVRAVNMLMPKGDLSAEVLAAVGPKRSSRVLPILAGSATLAALAYAAMNGWTPVSITSGTDTLANDAEPRNLSSDSASQPVETALGAPPNEEGLWVDDPADDAPEIPTYRRTTLEDATFFDFSNPKPSEDPVQKKPSYEVISITYVCNLEAANSNSSSCYALANRECRARRFDSGQVLNPVADQPGSPNWRGTQISCFIG